MNNIFFVIDYFAFVSYIGSPIIFISFPSWKSWFLSKIYPQLFHLPLFASLLQFPNALDLPSGPIPHLNIGVLPQNAYILFLFSLQRGFKFLSSSDKLYFISFLSIDVSWFFYVPLFLTTHLNCLLPGLLHWILFEFIFVKYAKSFEPDIAITE